MDTEHNLPAGLDDFRLLYRQCLDNRQAFWADQARHLFWHREFTTVVEEDFSRAKVSWFGNGQINAAANALDHWIEKGRADQAALTVYRDGKTDASYTFSQLQQAVHKLCAAFKQNGIAQGDCIALNLPNSPEFVICALACARMGITYLPIGCHLPAALVAAYATQARARLLVIPHQKGDARTMGTAEKVYALLSESTLTATQLITTGQKLDQALTLEEYTAQADDQTPDPAVVDADFPLFAIYENRVGGQPVGTIFGTGGFLVQARTSFDLIFNKPLSADQGRPEQIVTTLDPATSAWQAYGLWGPLTNGKGIIIADAPETEAPDARTLAAVLADHPHPALLCRPSLLAELKTRDESNALAFPAFFSLIACCGEALAPRLVNFADQVLVPAPERVVNMWIQNQCGTALINAYPLPQLNRPGSLGLGALGVEPVILNDFGEPCKTNVSGNLVFKHSWPAMGRPTYGGKKHYIKASLTKFEGHFLTHDGVRADKDGFYWFMGRLDDVIKIKGQALGTALIESMLMSHPLVDEAAIISTPGSAGQTLVAFVVSGAPVADDQSFTSQINAYIAEKIGDFAIPDRLIIARQLPRTATSKLVRGMLRRIASGNADAIEDTSHLANADAIQELIDKA